MRRAGPLNCWWLNVKVRQEMKTFMKCVSVAKREKQGGRGRDI